MPYQKSYSKKKYKRPGYYSCGKMVAGDAKQALALAKNVKSLLNVEFKNHDISITPVGIPDGVGVIHQLTNIPQGDTGESRDGSNIKITSIYIKLLLNINVSAITTSVRVLLVQDKQTNQTIYATSDLLSTVANVQSIVSPMNLDNQFRFKVLYDKVFSIDDNGVQTKFIKIYKKVSTKLRFDASIPSIADLRSSSYSLVLISDETTNEPVVTGELRLRYLDN